MAEVTNDSEARLRELHDSYQAARTAVVNPDYLSAELNEANQKAYKLDQIGAHEHIARRHWRADPRRGMRYQGPEASEKEREQAYEKFLKANPHIQKIELPA